MIAKIVLGIMVFFGVMLWVICAVARRDESCDPGEVDFICNRCANGGPYKDYDCPECAMDGGYPNFKEIE